MVSDTFFPRTEQRSSMEPGQLGALIADLKERSEALWRYL